MSPACLLAIVLAAVPTAHQAVEQPSLRHKLEQKVEGFSVEEDTFLQVLAKFGAEFQIPLGIEWIAPLETSSNIQLSWREATVREILNSLVYSQQGYDFEVGENIVHIFPSRSHRSAANFLNLRIERFQISNQSGAFASYMLRNRVRSLVVPSTLPPGAGVGASIGSGLGDRMISLDLQDVTVRAVLDEISRVTELKVWLIVYPESADVTPRGFYRTVSVRGSAIRDDEQPVWHLLMWGYDPVRMERRQDWKLLRPASGNAVTGQRPH